MGATSFQNISEGKVSLWPDENLFIRWLWRHNLEPGRQLQQIYWPRKPPGSISPGYLDRVYKSLRVMYTYINNRVQGTKVCSYYTEDLDIICVLQGSILGPLLFNKYNWPVFIKHYRSCFSKYADDTIPYNCGNTFLGVISDLEPTIGNLFDWFCCNNFDLDISKCHKFSSPFNLKSINIKILL